MGLKVKIKLALTITASVLAVGHLFFPKISIDLITVSLLAIAVVPWLDILFKSVELPGGVKLEFHELEKISNEAERIGLIKPEVASDGDENLVTKEGYYFVEMASSNQELALVSLRIEIEKRLRDIAAKYNIDGRGYSLSRLMDIFAGRHILSTEEIAVLKDMVATLNQAAHGVQFDERNADWIIVSVR
jgi:hypothetical protein